MAKIKFLRDLPIAEDGIHVRLYKKDEEIPDAGKNLIDRAYQEAIARRYRFYSFGDAMLIV